MATVRDLLDRFRPAGAPGPATLAGVPADRRETVAAELEPVFAELAGTVLECRDLRRAGGEAAARREVEAGEQARALISRARAEGETQRAAAAATVREEAASTARQSLARARAEAEEIRRRGAANRADVVARVLERARADLRALASGAGAHGGEGPR